ncbi:MAG: hypothetical protein JNM44_07640 [Chitinophagaceae bacterium]|nr:hypothetical protein [Chitinophagaceae bacterium]
MKKYIALTLMIGSLVSCKKEPGFGGRASIQGKVFVYDTNKEQTDTLAEGYLGNINVFISVDGQEGVLEQVDTDLNGSYKIEELRKGTYQLWVYSDCLTCPDDREAIKYTVTISGNKDEMKLPDFIIRL